MLLKIDDETVYSVHDTTYGMDIIKATQLVNYAHQDVCEYGYERILYNMPVKIITGIQKLEKKLQYLLEDALILKEGESSVSTYLKYAQALVRGYNKMKEIARIEGLSKLNIDYYDICIFKEDGSRQIIYFTRDEDTKKALYRKLSSDIVVYTAQEVGEILAHDDFTHAMKREFDARLTKVTKGETKTN